MRVAIVHYWLVGMRGGESVLEQICRIYPEADIFTHVLRRERISPAILAHSIRTSFIDRLPFAGRHYSKYLAFMPRALEELDLTGYDLVISSESGPAKGVIVPPTAKHICYCHSPMRYIWDHYHLYREELGWPARAVFSPVAHRLRQWDVSAAARVDRFVANSHFVAQRIRRYYRRDADVVHPPVDLTRFSVRGEPEDFYLFVGELVGYKRLDLAIAAFQNTSRRLVVVGDGADSARLRRNCGPNIEMLGRVPWQRLAELYAGCRALVFPGEEDFGIVPIEAMACGRPVIAYGSGGALDTVVPRLSGVLFPHQSVEALRHALDTFEAQEPAFDPHAIARHAAQFSQERFRREFGAIIAEELGGLPKTKSPAALLTSVHG